MAAQPGSVSPRRGIRAGIADSLMVPAKSSPRSALWIRAYRALHVPFAIVGTARRYRVSLDGVERTVVCVGRQARFRRLLTRVFGSSVELVGVARGLPLWSRDRNWPTDAALVAIELHPSFATRFRNSGWLICPELVRWRGDLSEMPPARPSRSLRIDLRRVEHAGYTLREAVGSKLDWNEFRQEMLVPYAARRFQHKARLPAPALLWKLEKDGKLLFLIKEGRRIAGQAVLCNRDEVRLAALGVRAGDLGSMNRERSLAFTR